MQIKTYVPIWIYFYIAFVIVLSVFHTYWIPTTIPLSHKDERLNTLTVYDQPVYGKAYTHPINGSFRLVNLHYHLRMATTSTLNVLQIRAWFDEETAESHLVMNGQWHDISQLQTYSARRYHLLTHTENLVDFRFVTTNQPFFSFDKASIAATSISQVNITFIVFYLVVALHIFVLVYAIWHTTKQLNPILGAVIATFISSVLLMWVATHHPLAMVYMTIYGFHANIILTIASVGLLWLAPHISAHFTQFNQQNTHLNKYWDGYVIVLIHAIILFISIGYQDIISRGNNSYGFDGAIYFTMTEQLIANQTVTHLEPLVTRIGIPWIVAQLFPNTPLLGWQIITTVSGFICSIVFYALSRDIITRPIIRIVIVSLFMMHWLAPLRYSWYHPVTLDAPLSALMLIAVWTTMQYRKSMQYRWLLAFAINLYIGITVREVPILFLGFLFITEPQILRHPITTLKQPDVQKRILIYVLMSVAALILYWGIKESVVPTKTHSAIAQAYRQLMYRPTYYWVMHAWFNTSGLLIIFMLVGYRSSLRFFRQYSHIAYLIVVITLLSFVSGTDKDRFLLWINPFLLLLAAYCVEANLKLFNTVWSVIILYIQLIVGRAFWETPDPGQQSRVIDTTFFTHFGDNFFFLELWPHHAQDKYHSQLATQQFVWTFFILLGIYCLRAVLLRRNPSDTTQTT